MPGCARSCSVEAGCQDVCGTYGTLAGGSAPFQYKVDGQLPADTTLNGLALSGTFAQPPNNQTQSYSFTVQLIDAAGATATVTANFSVNPHIVLSPDRLIDARLGQNYDVLIPYTSSQGTPSVTLSGSLPPGLAISLVPPNVRISGRTNSAGTYGFKITLTDQAICGPNQVHCSVTQDYTIAVI
jgi:hypothetical protein